MLDSCTFWSSTSTSTSTLAFPCTKYSSTSSTDKYVLKYKYQVQVLYLTPTLVTRFCDATILEEKTFKSNDFQINQTYQKHAVYY